MRRLSKKNIELPILYAGLKSKERKKRVAELLSRVGLADKAANKPTEMSGGEMQRTAIARALANNPGLILADEPTGNLDTASGREIINIFEELWHDGRTVIVITHDTNIAKRCQRLIRLKDGLIDTDNGNGNGNHRP
jgi:putative ABC transport system ATP-binding protein